MVEEVLVQTISVVEMVLGQIISVVEEVEVQVLSSGLDHSSDGHRELRTFQRKTRGPSPAVSPSSLLCSHLHPTLTTTQQYRK